ncbi:DUF2339 domain-containing protein [Chryseobacterium profundimaris]|uniref:Predicted membrane protein n=1 Tax=Chryseobacterium profundimaris TaxID=1387275 RepID=A0ABY1PH93_9FLAO|nr:DUF2339 domain-containing protein [Chryseobacterium profundimaris]SMP34053.1 Predicted membrane protein [Chryseobacterium profundimaris]
MSILIIILFIIIIIFFCSLNIRIRNLEKEIAKIRAEQSENPKDEIIDLSDRQLQPLGEDISEIEINPTEVTDIEKESKINISPVLEFLRQNALAIAGIFTLVLGIGYFVKYAIDKNWIGEVSRAGIGFAAGSGIIGIGHFLRKNYTVFASIITGGGIAVLYFTTTIAFREYHLFSQSTAFSVTCFVTLVSIFLSYYYKSEILIVFSLFGGFLAPLMISSGHGNYPFLFTYITVINIGMLVIAFLKQWKSIGWIAFIFTSIYLFYWTVAKTDITAVYFYVLSYIIFYAFALQNYFTKKKLLPTDILMLVLINFISIIGTVFIFKELQYDPVIVFPLVFALLNGFLLYRKHPEKKLGTAHSIFSGITVSLITAAFALEFSTHLITTVWAIEATLLLFIWKKTGLRVFRIFFYILFSLVIIAQIMTWVEYIDAKNLNIIFNPVFLTSSVTVFTTFINLILLRKTAEKTAAENSFFENFFAVVSYSVIYIALLLEIIYHISEKPLIIIFSTGMLFSLYYIFIILLFRRKLEIGQILETGLLYSFFSLLILNSTIAGSGLITDMIINKIEMNNYFIYGLYLIPLLYTFIKILPQSDFFKIWFSYWLLIAVIVTTVSMEALHLYTLLFAENINEMEKLQEYFTLLHLPIIWAILASFFIYKGLKTNAHEYGKAGFALLGITIIKLYFYDVWKMDNVSRIIAFIILGIILLLSSFLFQRLKNIVTTMVEKKDAKDQANIK